MATFLDARKSSENNRPVAVTEPNARELSFVEIAEALDTMFWSRSSLAATLAVVSFVLLAWAASLSTDVR